MVESPYDVVVVGAGPAGSACAASLRRIDPRLVVLVLERTCFDEPRIGEVLPAAALPLLRRIGFPVEALPGMSQASHLVASAWGHADLVENHHLFSAAGAGFHLDRMHFDRALCGYAGALGAEVRVGTAVRSVAREGSMWRLELNDGTEVMARFVVDASGRRCQLARGLGVRVQALDGMTAYSFFFREEGCAEASAVIEACEHGWWYTAPLPGGRRIVSFLSDVDLARDLELPSSEAWFALLRGTVHIARLVQGAEHDGDCVVRPASTAMLHASGGEGWLAAGDALASCDPLAAQGITKALHSGILASYAAADALRGDAGEGHARYGALMAQHMDGYLRMHAMHYAQESRWPAMPFWSRRQRGRIEEAA